jgi:hypothetical protein
MTWIVESGETQEPVTCDTWHHAQRALLDDLEDRADELANDLRHHNIADPFELDAKIDTLNEFSDASRTIETADPDQPISVRAEGIDFSIVEDD